jgi:four helix bundle protein
MPLAKTFEELRIWQNSRELVGEIYAAFKGESKKYQDYAFRDQIQRAAVSVMNNIAEGYERGSRADFARFLDIAKGSCGEVRSMTYIAEDLEYMNPSQAANTRELSLKLTKGIAALTKSLRNK